MGDPRAAGLYSIEWRAAARSVLLAGCDPDDPQKRALTQTKSNIGELAESVGYVIERDERNYSKARFYWSGVSDLTPRRILANQADEPHKDKRNALADAESFLQEVLKDGEVAVKDIEAEAANAGISRATLRRAKDSLRVRAMSTGFKEKTWYWRLDAQKSTVGAQISRDEHLRVNGNGKSSYSNGLAVDAQISENEHLREGDEHLRWEDEEAEWVG